MKIFPAIDLKDGKVVRLFQGDYDKVERYDIEPAEAARDFHRRGAKYLHVVDLDGAKGGATPNYEVIGEILRAAPLFVEVGGGIRDTGRIQRYLEAGAGRVILGTAAARDPDFLRRAAEEFGRRVAVGIDVRGGYAAVEGWTRLTARRGTDFCREVRDMGVATVIYTVIENDGALSGTDTGVYEELSAITGLDIIASGGISDAEEIKKLAASGIYGAIIGKALYTGALRLEDAIAAAGPQ